MVMIVLRGMAVVGQHVVLGLVVAEVLVRPAVEGGQRRHAVVVHAAKRRE